MKEEFDIDKAIEVLERREHMSADEVRKITRRLLPHERRALAVVTSIMVVLVAGVFLLLRPSAKMPNDIPPMIAKNTNVAPLADSNISDITPATTITRDNDEPEQLTPAAPNAMKIEPQADMIRRDATFSKEKEQMATAEIIDKPAAAQPADIKIGVKNDTKSYKAIKPTRPNDETRKTKSIKSRQDKDTLTGYIKNTNQEQIIEIQPTTVMRPMYTTPGTPPILVPTTIYGGGGSNYNQHRVYLGEMVDIYSVENDENETYLSPVSFIVGLASESELEKKINLLTNYDIWLSANLSYLGGGKGFYCAGFDYSIGIGTILSDTIAIRLTAGLGLIGGVLTSNEFDVENFSYSYSAPFALIVEYNRWALMLQYRILFGFKVGDSLFRRGTIGLTVGYKF